MIRILSIGNSFSQDAHAYLHAMGESGGVKMKTVNLYIGGCSLKTHWENAQSAEKRYLREENGEDGRRKNGGDAAPDVGDAVSLREGVAEEAWDIVTFQQASHDSGLPETYFPYLELLADYVSSFAPGARLMLHQTWAYETDSHHEMFYRYGNDQRAMYAALKAAYAAAAAKMDMAVIPCGDVIQALRGEKAFDYEHGGLSLCRDGFHLSYVYGRYAAAAAWYETLFGGLRENGFMPPGEDVDPELVRMIKEVVTKTAGKA